MKLLLVAMSLMISAVLLGAAAGNPTVTYVDHGKVAKGGTLVTAPDLSVSINKRTGPGQVEVHDKETDTFYVLEGTIRVFLQQPKEDVRLSRGQTFSVPPKRPHLVTNAGETSAVFLVLQGIGEYDFVPLV